MKKFLLLLVLCVALFGAARPTQDDFNACYEKNKNSIISVNGNYGVAVAKNLIAVVKNSDTKINNFIKFDPYLNLYLVKSDKDLQVPIMVDENDEANFNKTKWIGNINDNNSTKMGHIKSFGVNLGDLDSLNFDLNVTSELNSACCKMVGIAIGMDKFIPNRYLKHFANYDDVYYGDIGAVFTQVDNKFLVYSVDPLGRGNTLLKDDEILSIDGVKPSSLRLLNEAVLFAKKGSILEFKIKRKDEELKLFIPVSGDIKLKDNAIKEKTENKINVVLNTQNKKPQIDEYHKLNEILKQWGVVVDTKLMVKRVFENSQAHKFGVVVGDDIVQVGTDIVKTRKDLQQSIGDQRSFLLLLKRNDFDFFVRVTR